MAVAEGAALGETPTVSEQTLGQGALRRLKRRVADRGLRWLIRRVALLVLVAIFVFPFVVMIATAFKNVDDIFHAPPRLLPKAWTLANFRAAFDQIPLWRYLGNTVLLCALTVLGTLFSCPLVAYALAKIRWRLQKPLLLVVLGTMMLPPQVTLIPIYLMWNKVDLSDTYLPLVVPSFLGTAFLIFMIRQFLMVVPDELIDSAKIDGASEFRTYWSVVLPLARPALATAAVLQFVWTWTDFLNPLIYLNNANMYTLSIGLYGFFSTHSVAWGPLMAACVLFTLPAFAIFLVGQRYFTEGIATTGIQ